jgi:hypothetical protein
VVVKSTTHMGYIDSDFNESGHLIGLGFVQTQEL